MKKLGLLLIVFIAVGSFSSCMKESEPYDAQFQFGVEKDLIEAYLAEELPNAMFHEDESGFGIWYELTSPGTPGDYEYKIIENTGSQPGTSIEAPVIQVKYTGKLLDGRQFDASKGEDGATFSLAGVIPAWQVAFLPRMIGSEEVSGITSTGLHPGAKIRFITPSIYAYGPQQNGSIPANSPLEFTIEVLDVRAPSTNSGN